MALTGGSAATSERDELERTQRRSLLPKPGSSRYSTRLQTASILADQSVGTAGSQENPSAPPDNVEPKAAMQEPTPTQSRLGRLRPRSMYQPSTAPSRQVEPVEKSTAPKPIRPPVPVSKRTLPTSNTAGLSRSQSLRKPTVSSVASQQTSMHGHSRTHSTSTLAMTKKDAVKSQVGLSERPKSLLVAPSGQSKPAVTSASSNQTRMLNRLNGTHRSINGKSRPEVANTGAIDSSVSKTEEAASARPRKREAVADEPKVLSKPAFSTLQQHFTPRKAGKAPTASFLHPTNPQGIQSLPTDMVNLQCELLQLHLLHRSVEDVCHQWESSAKLSLHTRFEEIAGLYQVMLDDEHEGQEQKNIQSLLEWSSGASPTGLTEHIQALSGPLHDLPSLVEPNGRLRRLVIEFERWASRVEQLSSARKDVYLGDEAAETIEGLGDSWKSENMALVRKLTSFARDLETLSQPSHGSSISCMVEMCKSLLAGILKELQIMQLIEAYVVDSEKKWVESQLDRIAGGFGTVAVESNASTMAWRS